MALPGELDELDLMAVGAHRRRHGGGLRWRDDRIVESLKQQSRPSHLRGTIDRRSIAVDLKILRQRSDEPIEVAGLEVVRALGQGHEIGDPVPRHRPHEGSGGQAQQGGQAARAGPTDRRSGPIDPPLLGEAGHQGHAVIDVCHAPSTIEPMPIGRPEARRPGVVRGHDAQAT